MVEVQESWAALPEEGSCLRAPSQAGRVPSGALSPVEPSGALILTVDGGSSWETVDSVNQNQRIHRDEQSLVPGHPTGELHLTCLVKWCHEGAWATLAVL